jgi:hypothetical protein
MDKMTSAHRSPRPPQRKPTLAGEHDVYPFVFYKIREETSINNHGGATTRPAGTIARTVGKATCSKCGHKWQSEPYSACGAGHHWFSGPCPQCGYAVGGAGSYSSDEGKPIECCYGDVILPSEAAEPGAVAERKDEATR